MITVTVNHQLIRTKDGGITEKISTKPWLNMLRQISIYENAVIRLLNQLLKNIRKRRLNTWRRNDYRDD